MTLYKMDKTLSLIHTEIHALRLLEGHKPSQFEIRVNKIISEAFQKECQECKERFEKSKTTKPLPTSSGFSIKGLLTGEEI